MSEAGQFITTAEVAAIVCVPIETVRFWRHVGKGPKSFKVPGGRRVLYAREDVEAWIAEARGSGSAGTQHRKTLDVSDADLRAEVESRGYLMVRPL